MTIQIDGNGSISGYARGSNALGSAGSIVLRNKLLNPTFVFNHRAVNLTLTAGQYSLDRWKGGSGGCTYSVALSGNARQVTITAGTLVQVVEAWHIEGGTYTLSWTGTAQARVNGGSYGSSGMTFSATANTDVTIEFNAGTIFQPQFELGTIPTIFEQRFVPLERILLQRYFQTTMNAPALNIIKLTTATGSFGGTVPQSYPFASWMRTTPTPTFYSDTNRSNPGNVMKNGSTVTAIANGVSYEVQQAGFKYWVPSAFTVVGDYANFAVDFDAEL